MEGERERTPFAAGVVVEARVDEVRAIRGGKGESESRTVGVEVEELANVLVEGPEDDVF